MEDVEDKEHIKRLEELLNQAKRVIAECPLGWHEDKLIRHRSTADVDVIDWLKRLHDLKL